MIRRLDPRDNVEYRIIHDAKASGAVVGYFRGRKIRECVTDPWGRNYIYSGIIEKQRGGRYDLGRLRPFEFILEPGIVYKMQVDAPRKSILGDAAAQWRQNVRLLVDRWSGFVLGLGPNDP